MPPRSSSDKTGLLCALSAYVIWGFLPLYWGLMSSATPAEILAHRIVWSSAFLFFLLIFKKNLAHTFRTWKELFGKGLRGGAGLLLLSTLFSSGNWLINIMGVHIGRVVELGIGTFLTPLATMAIGIAFFSERISKIRLFSILLAAIGAAVLAAGLDRFPWIALSVSGTWATYGALKKKIPIPPSESVSIEHAIMLLPAAGFLLFADSGAFAAHFAHSFGSGLSWALLGTGIVTATPMILFSLAAQKLPMTILGIIQYLCPVMTLLLGVFVFHEGITMSETAALAFILAAVALYIVGGLREKAA